MTPQGDNSEKSCAVSGVRCYAHRLVLVEWVACGVCKLSTPVASELRVGTAL